METHGSKPLVPVLSVSKGGSLTVNGSVSGGKVNVADGASLSGSGSVSSEEITIGSVGCLSDDQPTLSADILYLHGDGTLSSFHMEESTLFLSGSPVISEIVSSGDCTLIHSGPITMNDLSITGTLSLQSMNTYDETNPVSVIRGEIRGGTLCFSSGIYELAPECTVSGAVLNGGTGIVYDYRSASSPTDIPMSASPASVVFPETVDGKLEIPVQVIYATESKDRFGGIRASVDYMESTEYKTSDTISPSQLASIASTFAQKHDGRYVLGQVIEIDRWMDGVFSREIVDSRNTDGISTEGAYQISIVLLLKINDAQGGY